MSKRIIAMVIAIVLAAALFAGCGKKKMVIPEITSSDAGSVTGSGTNDAASSVAASSKAVLAAYNIAVEAYEEVR